jgi:hypothetical protein
VKVWPPNVSLCEHRFVELQHATHLPDSVVKIVQRVIVTVGSAYAVRRMGELSMQLGKSVALYVDPWIGAISQPGHCDVPVTGEDASLLIGHWMMLAPQCLNGPFGIPDLPRAGRPAAKQR